ncbi:hypothetical protein F5Y17DRAFT_428644 [Xylariaceae sp. FL0594]|nr:hypothetical protein F5Y17DRAFT_428644 [Xylariaceae sp. FL0594]
MSVNVAAMPTPQPSATTTPSATNSNSRSTLTTAMQPAMPSPPAEAVADTDTNTEAPASPPPKPNIWGIYAAMVAISTAFLAIALGVGLKWPVSRPDYCVVDNDPAYWSPVYWSQVCQNVMSFIVELILLFAVLFDQHKRAEGRNLRLPGYRVLYMTFGFCLTAQFVGVVLYAIRCEHGWVANILFSWAASVTVACVAAYFVHTIDAPRRAQT